MSSSSDDDAPLATLTAKKTVTTPKTKEVVKKEKKEVQKSEESSDSEDDIPLALLSKGKDKKEGSSGGVKRKRKSEGGEGGERETKKVKTSSSSAKADKHVHKWQDLADGNLKPQLVDRILCRWNYCGFQWPHPDDLLKEPKSNKFRKLAGFPGVFIGVKGSALGLIKDERIKEGIPCFSNLIKKNCVELRDLWVSGMEKQMVDLIKYEGENAPSSAALKQELKIARKLTGSALVTAENEHNKKKQKATVRK